jgi:hypothetical protein
MTQKEKNKFITLLFDRFIKRFGEIESFRTYLLRLQQNSFPMIYEDLKRQFENFAIDHANDDAFLDKEAFLSNIESFALEQGTNKLIGMERMINGSCFVFSHAVVDDSVTDMIRFTAQFDAPYWDEALQGRQVSLKQVRQGSYDQLLKEAKEKKVEELVKQSLPDRADAYLKIANSLQPERPGLEGYIYSRERLFEIDELRHELIHKGGPIVDIEHYDDDVWYLNQTFVYLVGFLVYAYEAKLDPEFMGTGSTA